ncbi:acyltransferase family protein [Vagococcus elongatus]|nr:acyltransferase family protein [Vagococcus elongatus]
MNHSKSSHYTTITIIQYIASVLIILVHCGRLFQHEGLHFFVKSMLCRAAVPFFLITTGYFLYKKSSQLPNYQEGYIRRLLKQYLFWSLIYLPYALLFLYQQKTPLVFVPIALVGALLYIGTCYHLWYFPSLLTGIWIINLLSKHKKILLSFGALLLLYSFGALETYSAYMENTLIGNLYFSYRQVFFTTRNGLFYSPIFIWSGFILAQNSHRSIFQKHLPVKLSLSTLLFCLEGWFVFQHQGDDKNFFFSLIPFSLFFLALILQSKQPICSQEKLIRFLTHKNFLLHPAFLEAIKGLSPKFFDGYEITGLVLFAITYAMTSFAALTLWKLSRRNTRQLAGGGTA